MFKYTKRLISDIQFWCREIKLRREEETELDRISDITFQEGFGGHETMAGFVYYQQMKRNRAERKRLHEEERDAHSKTL